MPGSCRARTRPSIAARPRRAQVTQRMTPLAPDPPANSEWPRLSAYASGVIEALDDPPFPANRRMEPTSPDVARRLHDFAVWLEQHRRELEELALAQKPAIDEAEKMLATAAPCRAAK